MVGARLWEAGMETLHQTVRGLHLLLDLNWDRLLFPVAIATALLSAAYLASL